MTTGLPDRFETERSRSPHRQPRICSFLACDPKSPGHWGMEPPACLVHKWFGADNGGLITHTSYLGD